jgi:hypothetical protein
MGMHRRAATVTALGLAMSLLAPEQLALAAFPRAEWV